MLPTPHDSKFMQRERTSLSLSLYGTFVYLCSNSLRKASMILEPPVERSHEAIRQWVQRLAPIYERFDVDRRRVRTIFVDETMIRIKGIQAWIWALLRAYIEGLPALSVSYNQSGLDAYLFLKEVKSRYGRKTVWTDEVVRYPEACRLLRLEHRVYPVQWKNLIERMNQALRRRLESFDDLFPRFKEKCDHGHVRNWISVFRYSHNVVRERQPTGVSGFIQSLSEALT